MSHMLKARMMRRKGVDIFFFDRKIMKIINPEPISDSVPVHVKMRKHIIAFQFKV